MADQTPRWWGKRVPTEFRFPPRAAEECGHKSVHLVQLDWDEEERASSAGGMNISKIGHLLSRYSICMIDGKPVEQDGAEVQALFVAGPLARKLIGAARAKLNEPEDSEISSFLGSATAQL